MAHTSAHARTASEIMKFKIGFCCCYCRRCRRACGVKSKQFTYWCWRVTFCPAWNWLVSKAGSTPAALPMAVLGTFRTHAAQRQFVDRKPSKIGSFTSIRRPFSWQKLLTAFYDETKAHISRFHINDFDSDRILYTASIQCHSNALLINKIETAVHASSCKRQRAFLLLSGVSHSLSLAASFQSVELVHSPVQTLRSKQQQKLLWNRRFY